MVECYCPKVNGELYYYYCGETRDAVILQARSFGLRYDKIVRIGIVERRAQKTMRKRSRKKRKRTASA